MTFNKHLLTRLYLLSAAVLMVSCKGDVKNDEGDIAYLGGEIINPSNPYVVLIKNKKPIDTLKLDENNRFLYKFKHLEAGLYTFHHGTDIQMVLIEPNDSLMLRLNTMDFDESLVYTGMGAKKNNFLIEMFLESEKEDQTVLKFCQYKPEAFERRLDSIKLLKQQRLDEFNSKNKNSELFTTVAKANIDYNYYMSKEVYPFAYYSNSELKNLKSLPTNFYSYRKDVDYNNETLKDYFPYYEFLKYHFRNLATSEHFKHSKDSVFDGRSVDYSLIKMKLIDSLVQNTAIKNNLLADTAFRFFNSSNNITANDDVLKAFLAMSSDSLQRKKGIVYTSTLKKLAPGNTLPDVKVLDFNSRSYELRDLVKKPTVFYFWSYTIRGHFKDSHDKIRELRFKYPEVEFIALNINGGDPKLWVRSLKQYNYTLDKEYVFENAEQAKETLALYPINKVILVDNKGKIVHANANMFSIKFEEELLGLINR
ncbi:MAG TPA: hypothetical protein VKZ97_01350 [Flavobacteriaceae bacterium]|nr:hypothetical protein [Flavobacteriaceae bacterium]